MKKTIASTNNTEPNIAALATLPPLPTDVLLWNDYQFPRAIANDDVSEDNTPTFSGKGEPGMTAVIDLGDGQSVRVPVNAEGNWSWTPAPALADGTYTWSVALEDAAGNRGESTQPITFTVDTFGNAVSISHAEDNTGTLTNPLASGSSTDDVNPVIVGTATPGSLVTLYVNGEAVGSKVADPVTGEWDIEINPALESGKTYEITAGEYSGPGEIPAPTRPFLLTVDTVVPTGSLDRIEDNEGRYKGDLANPGLTDDTTPTLHGTGRPGDIVFVRNGSDIIDSVTVRVDGSWEYTLPEQTNGTELDVSVVFRGPTGVESAPTAPWKLVIDTEAPNKPIIGDVEDDQGPVIGPIHNGDVTDDTQPVFSGEGAVPGETVELIIDDEVVGTGIVGEDGKWEVIPEKPLPEGEHEAVVVIVDPAGNASEPSDPIGFIVDTQPPAKPTIDTVYDNEGQQTGNIANGGITDDSTPDFTGTAEKGSLVFIIVNGRTVDSVTANGTGTWTWTPALGMANGHYDVTVVAQDKAGLRSEPSDAFSFDLLAGGIPTAPAITDVIDDVNAHVGTVQNGGITNDDRPTITGTAQDGTTVYLYDGANPNPIGSAAVTGGRWTIDFDTPLSQGEHRFRAVAEDVTGNRSPETGEWVIIVDSVDPLAATDIELWDDFGTPGLIANDDTTDDNTPTYRGKGEPDGTAIIDLGNGNTVRVPVDGKGNWSYTPAPALADGDYTWKVSIEDKAGNVGPASDPIHFIVDTSRNGVSISHVVDNEGDIVGNLGSGSHTDDTTPTVVGRATAGALVNVYVDGKLMDSVRADAVTGEWQYTISPALTADALYKITASEDAGAGESAQTAPFELTLDTRVPTGSLDRVADDVGLVQGDLANPAVTDDTTPTLYGKGVEGDVVFIYDGTRLIDSVTVGRANTWNFTLPQQNHGTELSLTAVFQGPTGVKSAPTAPWNLTIDTQAPDAPTIKGMYDDAGTLIADGGRSRDTTPELRGTAEKDSLVKIYVPGSKEPVGSVYADANGEWKWTPAALPDAKHEFYVKAQDKAGNVSGESNHYGLEIDTHAATPTIAGVWDNVAGGVFNGLVPNGGLTNDANTELRGTADKNGIVYIYNAYNNAVIDTVKVNADGSWSWPVTLANTAAGRPHMFYTIAKDDLGNTSAKSATYSINVDTVNNAPVISGAYDDVTGGVYNGLVNNGGVTNDKTPTLKGTAEAGSVVYISADGNLLNSVTAKADGSWEYTVTTNYNKTYSFDAYSIDKAGNRSANSAKFALTIDTVNNAPVITGAYDNEAGGVYNGLVGNGGVTNDKTPELRGTAEAGSVVYIVNSANGAVVASTTTGANGAWTLQASTNYNQTYNWQAYSIDKAGNRSGLSSNFALTIDTVNAAPVITGAYDNVVGGIYNGLVGNGGVTNDNTPELRGTAEAGSVVYIVNSANGAVVASTTTGANGAWTLQASTNYNQTYNWQAYSIDKAGNRSGLSSNFALTIDTVNAAPVITSVMDNVGTQTGNVANYGQTDDNTPTLNGTAEAGSTVYVAVNGTTYSTTAAANGTWSVTPPALPLGNHTVSVFSIDQAGNRSAGVTRSFTVVSPVTSGKEDFNALANTSLTIGKPTDSGFTLLSGEARVSTTVSGGYYSNPFLYIAQGTVGTTFTVGATDQVNFQLMGWGGYGSGTTTSTAYVKFYNAAGKEIGSLSGRGTGSTDYVNFKFQAPAGETIAKIHIYSNDQSGLGLDNISWGTQAASRSAGRSMSMMMNAEEQHDDNVSVVSTLNDREINLDNLQNKTIDLTNSKQDKLNISLNDVLTHAEKDLFIADGNKQLMVQGNKGDVLNLNDLLPDNTDPGNWTSAGNVKVSGVEYQVYQVENLDVELLVQTGVTVNVNNH